MDSTTRMERTAEQHVRSLGEQLLSIPDYDRMPPFLMALAGDGDCWFFVSSYGGLTAGRRSADGAILPYVTADRLHLAHGNRGPFTLVRPTGDSGRDRLWQPFDHRHYDPQIRRTLHKTLQGDRVVFEEHHEGLELGICMRWASSRELGWVRTTWIENEGNAEIDLEILDGLRDVLPFGIPLALYQRSSVLTDAYKRTEVASDTGLATYSLTSAIVDRAAAVEQLRANVIWSVTPAGSRVHLDPTAPERWRRGESLGDDDRLNGLPGAYWNRLSSKLGPGESLRWHQILDVGLDAASVVNLRSRLRQSSLNTVSPASEGEIEARLDEARARIECIVHSADGVQCTADCVATAHHYANVLFNCMRGGVLTSRADFPKADFADFLRVRNRPVLERCGPSLRDLPAELDHPALLAWSEAQGSVDLERLSLEYLPVFFGRRHGDPSRPWNLFSIDVSDERGQPRLSYEGNWRDIFQNWEALARSFPQVLEAIVTKFLNASTADGFNPYRLTRNGVEWEIEDPADPWSYIGYWGDHQIVYLTRLLESLEAHRPGLLGRKLGRRAYTYADVPYRIRPFRQLLADPHHTLDYDVERAARIEARVEAIGTDGRLRFDREGGIEHVSLLEKLLVPVLAKLSNFVLGGGIWMNTQRPEWNDANNALVGRGLSAVTLAYLRRHLVFLSEMLEASPQKNAPVTSEVEQWMRSLHEALPEEEIDDIRRRQHMEDCGRAYERYREIVYGSGPSGAQVELAFSDVRDFFREQLLWIDSSLAAQRRNDGLFHAYNLVEAAPESHEARVENLQLMLEGQVAVLSSGIVTPESTLSMIEKIFDSALYRPDQNSFVLYPIRQRDGFVEENTLRPAQVRGIELISALLEAGDRRLIIRDVEEALHFNGSLSEGSDVAELLEEIARDRRWRTLVERDGAAVMQLFEDHFEHRSYTGRSGAMYGYEGIGCIYWHMVAKLLVALQEVTRRARAEGANAALQADLARAYYRVRGGLGFSKTAQEYGAFPTDPYSHTPLHSGARQPGMTGQVKEEILTRLGELGVEISGGRIHFEPFLLRREELLESDDALRLLDFNGTRRVVPLAAGELGFGYLQVPVLYRPLAGASEAIRVFGRGTDSRRVEGLVLDVETSRSLFERRGEVTRIEVEFDAQRLLDL